MMATGRGLSSARLVDFGASVLHAVGVPIADARLVAHSLVEADLWGHHSHGMLRLRWYVGRLQSGAMRAVTEPETVVDGGAVAVLDGRDGVGQVLAMRAMREAIECARRRRRRRAQLQPLRHRGLLHPGGGIGGQDRHPHHPRQSGHGSLGGREKAVGANPWSIAAPAGRHDVAVMDIANTAVARGKIYAARPPARAARRSQRNGRSTPMASRRPTPWPRSKAS